MPTSYQFPFFGTQVEVAEENPLDAIDKLAEWTRIKGFIRELHDPELVDPDEVDGGIVGSISKRISYGGKKRDEEYVYYTFYSETLRARIDLSIPRKAGNGIGFYMTSPGTLPSSDKKGGFKGFSGVGLANGYREKYGGVQEDLQEMIEYLQDNLTTADAKTLKSELARFGVGEDREKYIHSHSLLVHLRRLFSKQLRESGYWEREDEDDD